VPAADTLKHTPLFERHREAGAKLVPFAGWEMPVQYEGVRPEHVAVRTACGVFDVSHMGEIETRGPGATDLLQSLLSNDVRRVPVGGAQYGVLCREDGGVLDDAFTYRLAERHYLTVTNAANHDKDLRWFEGHAADFDADVVDRLEDYAMLAIQGPRARRIVERLADGRLPSRMHCCERTVAGVPMLVCGTGYTGEDGVELLLAGDRAPAVWDALVEAGATPWPHGTRCASRSASTSTATTWTRSATRSRLAWAGAAGRRPASSARRRCARRARRAPGRSSPPSCSPAPGYPARATRSWAAAR
jgi:aminomethyltransferase